MYCSGSPALDVGDPTAAPATDFEGDPRPAGSGPDLGADERVAPCTAPATVTLADDTLLGEASHVACEEIVVGPSYTVGATGDLTLRTRGRVVFEDGFAVVEGGALRVVIDPTAGGL